MKPLTDDEWRLIEMALRAYSPPHSSDDAVNIARRNNCALAQDLAERIRCR